MRKKGQISSVDVLVATIIFLFVFAALRGVWINNISVAENTASATEMQLLATQAIDVFLKTPGYPADWTKESIDNITILGIADKPLVINPNKLSDFGLMCQTSGDYEKVKDLLGLGKYEYKFDFNNFSSPDENITCGKNVNSIGTIVSVKRIIYYGGRMDVTFTVFK